MPPGGKSAKKFGIISNTEFQSPINTANVTLGFPGRKLSQGRGTSNARGGAESWNGMVASEQSSSKPTRIIAGASLATNRPPVKSDPPLLHIATFGCVQQQMNFRAKGPGELNVASKSSTHYDNFQKNTHNNVCSHLIMPSMDSSTANSIATKKSIATAVNNSQVGWLMSRLLLGGMPEPLALDCEQKLVYTEGFSNVRDFAECPPSMFHRDYLTGIGITGLGTQQQLLRLHTELHAQYQQPVAASTSLPPTTVPAPQKTTGNATASSDSSCKNISASSIRPVKNYYSATTADAPTNNNKRTRSNSSEYSDAVAHQFVPRSSLGASHAGQKSP